MLTHPAEHGEQRDGDDPAADAEPAADAAHHGAESVSISGPLSANNGEIVQQWALDGHGIILRSLWDVGPSLQRGDLVRVLPDYVHEADVWAVYPSRLSTSARLRVCVEFLEKWLGGVEPGRSGAALKAV